MKREQFWQQPNQSFDLIIVGGGITGVGILREATRAGLRAILLEARDFAWGTSSRSSKLVHGGLRYLAQGQVRVTRDSVIERQHLLHEGAGLIEPLGFVIAGTNKTRATMLKYRAGLALYDALAHQWHHSAFGKQQLQRYAPHINDEFVEGLRYIDAQTDDARLVLRVLYEAIAAGATALNYAPVTGLIRENEAVVGVKVRDQMTETEHELRATVVINATGAWVDKLRGDVGAPPKMRPLRGSHLVFQAWRVPVAQSVSFAHPVDARPMFIFPWEGVTVIGTTDLDHSDDLNVEPAISAAEADYLLQAVQAAFPVLKVTFDDVIATWSGVRPVVGTGASDPSKESRDYVVWNEHGLLTVTGGKLTTFKLIALDALNTISERFPNVTFDPETRRLDELAVDLDVPLGEMARQRLLGRYGAMAQQLVADYPDELEPIGHTSTLWAELRWAAAHEAVQHLDDLLLRRTRLGILFPHGAADLFERVRVICHHELGWDDARWQHEVARYQAIIAKYYSLPTNVQSA